MNIILNAREKIVVNKYLKIFNIQAVYVREVYKYIETLTRGSELWGKEMKPMSIGEC